MMAGVYGIIFLEFSFKINPSYSRILLSRTLKGNQNLFEIANVRHSEIGVKLHPEHIYRR